MFTANFPTIPAHITYGHEQAISLLRRRYSFPGSENRISAIEGNLLTLRTLTNMAKANGVDGRSFGLKMLFSTGWYITQTCRNLIEDYWGAPLLDRYGVTEVNGDAKQCSACNMFHFDPFVIEEVLSPDEDKPIEEGIGRIVLTGLFPFNQVAPKIRYVIGDYVEKVMSPCGNGQPGYRFLGRMKQTLLHRDPNGMHFILFPSEIADVLDEFEEVYRRPNTGFLGFTSALVGKERPSVTVTVEVEAGATPSQRIRQRLLERSYFLRQALEHELVSSLDIEIVAPGSLKTIHKI
jgi:phenylacetate-coenzyme A ligase PaaK-like adenylate-forming protein